MSKSLDVFTGQLRAQQVEMVANATESFRSLALAAYHDLQKDAKTASGYGSPVASGRFASSMRVSLDSVDTSTAAPDPEYKYPKGKGKRQLPERTIQNQPISNVSLLLRRFKLGQTIYISNSVPYGRRIEVGGHSWQTPGGVFAPTMRKLMAQFRNFTGKVFGG